MLITLNEVDYNFKNDFNELTIYEYMEVQKILGEHEKRKSDNNIINDESIIEETDKGNTEIYEIVPIEEESLTFKVNKYYKLIKMLSNIPDKILDEYIIKHCNELNTFPELLDIMLNYIVVYDESSKTDKIKHYAVELNDKEGLELFNDTSSGYIFEDDDNWFFIPNFNMIRFQEWSDIETFTTFNKNVIYILISLIRKFDEEPIIEEIGSKFNKRLICKNIPKYKKNSKLTFTNEDKEYIVSSMLTKDIYWLLKYFIDETSNIKDSYRYIYGEHNVKSEPSPNYDKFSQMIGWEDTICRLAETPVFNSNNGSLYTVRNSYFIDVLEYLNVKRGRDIVENQDYEYRQNKQK